MAGGNGHSWETELQPWTGHKVWVSVMVSLRLTWAWLSTIITNIYTICYLTLFWRSLWFRKQCWVTALSCKELVSVSVATNFNQRTPCHIPISGPEVGCTNIAMYILLLTACACTIQGIILGPPCSATNRLHEWVHAMGCIGQLVVVYSHGAT